MEEKTYEQIEQIVNDFYAKIKKWADTNTATYTQPQANVWKCKYHRQDMNIDIQLTILAFDLYVDKSQFKDGRYEK